MLNSGGTSRFQALNRVSYDSSVQDLSNDMSYVGAGLSYGIAIVITFQPYGTILTIREHSSCKIPYGWYVSYVRIISMVFNSYGVIRVLRPAATNQKQGVKNSYVRRNHI